MAASVRTRVVSWKNAAEMNESVESEALVRIENGTPASRFWLNGSAFRYQEAGARRRGCARARGPSHR
jgi:hypothetical protein